MSDDPRPEDVSAEGEGDSVGEAKCAAMKELEPRFPGITAECVELRGGRGAGARRPRARARGGRRGRLARRRRGDPEEPGERVRAVVDARGARAGAPGDRRHRGDRGGDPRTVNGDELGLLIGKHGSTIDAVQHLAFRAAYRGREDRKQVTVDAAGYRERRETALHRMADRAAAEALRYDRAVELEPMRAPERKIVHTYLSERADVETHSEGDEPDRRLVISPAPAFREP